MKTLGITILIILVSVIISPFILRVQLTFFPPPAPIVETDKTFVDDLQIFSTPTPTQIPVPISFEIPQKTFVAQTFNNCGPATLSMIMSYFGVYKSQIDLGQEMRPYQNPQGDNDDKSIFAPEFVAFAQKNGLESLHRPNGTIDLLKQFIVQGIPVVVRTWLHPNEDIGHFRIIRGYDDETQVVIQDDSYEGPNRRIPYSQFDEMWQPFNYGYILVYSSDKQLTIDNILKEEKNEQVAWKNSIRRAEKELSESPQSFYSKFNIATAQYNLGNYKEALDSYEAVESQLPFRMLWYQIEPIITYQKIGNYERVFQLSDRILNNHNRGFSELYQIRGEVYLLQGNEDLARVEFEKAVYYNKNFLPAQDSLNNL